MESFNMELINQICITSILVVTTLIGIGFLVLSVITVADYFNHIKTKNNWFKKKQ